MMSSLNFHNVKKGVGILDNILGNPCGGAGNHNSKISLKGKRKT
jgi:hypothetical protein